jgi:hypothetical protein
VIAHDEGGQRHEWQEAGRSKQGADIRPAWSRGLIQRISGEPKRRHGGEPEQRPVHPDDAPEARRVDNLTSAHDAHDESSRRPPRTHPYWKRPGAAARVIVSAIGTMGASAEACATLTMRKIAKPAGTE